MISQIVKRTQRVPLIEGADGNGEAIARQLDVALMKVGFKLSGELLTHLSTKHPAAVKNLGDEIILAVRELLGDHVRHNVYFRDFPENVPDTTEFWLGCIADALSDLQSAPIVALELSMGSVNLLDLPKYGKYLHSFEDMVAAHDQFVESLTDRITVLQLGGTLVQETTALYFQLAGSRIPLNEQDQVLLRELADVCLFGPQPEKIPVRENRAIINSVRLQNGQPLQADTVTDILRLACFASGGDVSLQSATKFGSFSRPIRRALLGQLDQVIAESEAKLADVNQHAEPWKRLGEKLHPHEYPRLENAAKVFAVARGDQIAKSLAAKVEMAFEKKNIPEAITLLSRAPGMLMRSLDRTLRNATGDEAGLLAEAVSTVLGKVSGRVILSVREQLLNRLSGSQIRIFVNQAGKAWTGKDQRSPLPEKSTRELLQVLDEEILRRLPAVGGLIVAPEVKTLALPLSDKAKASGFAVMPRGSTQAVKGDLLRFFIYWKQHHQRTDYDLSLLILNAQFNSIGQVSFTNLRSGGRDIEAVHSGDITNAPNGASEFIDVDLKGVSCAYLVPQVNIYSGEDFTEVEEAFFGFMTVNRDQRGLPFEPRTVRTKSDLRGKGNVALPVAFARQADGSWEAKWLNMFLNGHPAMNRVEGNRVSTSMLVKALMSRQFLPVTYLTDLWQQKAKDTMQPVVYIGLELGEISSGARVYTLSNLTEIIPA